MEALRDQLRICGVTNAVFEDLSPQQQHGDWANEKQSGDYSSSKFLLADYDLFGLGAYRSHFPHFATDVLWILYAYGMWWSRSHAAQEHRSGTCFFWRPANRNKTDNTSDAPRSFRPTSDGGGTEGWIERIAVAGGDMTNFDDFYAGSEEGQAGSIPKDTPVRLTVPSPLCRSPRHDSLAPLLFMHEGKPPFGWLQEFASMLFAHTGGALLLDHKVQRPMCYRSLFVSRADKYVTMSTPHPALDVDHPFFIHNNLSRAPLSSAQRRRGSIFHSKQELPANSTNVYDQHAHASSQSSPSSPSLPAPPASPSPPCYFNITIITRKSEFGRSLVGTDKLSSNLEQLCHSFIPAFLSTCHINSVSFEGTTLAYQQQVMQNTDLAIFAHGAAVANMIFMRFGAAILEIFPFGEAGAYLSVWVRKMFSILYPYLQI